MKFVNFIKTHQQSLVFLIGYILVGGLSFGLGRISASAIKPPEIRVEEAFVPQYDTPEPQSNQLATIPSDVKQTATQSVDCLGKIKGNIGSKNDKVYHLPGTSFYNRTKPEACFVTEAEAIAAGFRKAGN